MTLLAEARYVGDGSTRNFAFNFRYINVADIKVWKVHRTTFAYTVLALTTDYVVEGLSIRLTTAHTSAYEIVIFRQSDFSQRPDGDKWSNRDKISATVHNRQDDADLYRTQELQDLTGVTRERTTGELTAGDKVINGVANPTGPTSAVNMQTLEGLLNGGEEQTATSTIEVVYNDIDDADNPVNGINRTFVIITDEGVTIPDVKLVTATVDGMLIPSTELSLSSDKKGFVFSTAPSSGGVVRAKVQLAAIPYVAEAGLDPSRIALTEGYFIIGGSCGCGEEIAKANIPISGFGAAAANVAMGGFKITDLADPTAASQEAATAAYAELKASTLGNFPQVDEEVAYTLGTAVQNTKAATQLIIVHIDIGSTAAQTFEFQTSVDAGFTVPKGVSIHRNPSGAQYDGSLMGFVKAGQYWRVLQTEGSTTPTMKYQRGGIA